MPSLLCWEYLDERRNTFVTILAHLFHDADVHIRPAETDEVAAQNPTWNQSATGPDNGDGQADVALMARICWHHFQRKGGPRMRLRGGDAGRLAIARPAAS
jgi:hypothetical protein